ncbi:MAG TPA: ATP synthase F1 subunit epsilon [Candidatus Binataceae bacterium]
MASTFEFKLVTPTGAVFEGAVQEVTAQGPRGEFGVLAEHINLITSLVPGVLQIKRENGAVENWVISGGLAEIKNGQMTLLANGAETPASIDRAAVEAEERDAEDHLARMSSYDAEYALAQEAFLLARARKQGASLPGAAR